MSAESYLNKKLSRFSIVDLSCIKLVYFTLSLLAFALYPRLGHLAWWFYAILTVISIFPLWVHLFSQKGKFIKKMHAYLKKNTSSNQILLFFSCFFFALMLGVFFPIITEFQWWVYVIVSLLFAIKPLTVSWIW